MEKSAWKNLETQWDTESYAATLTDFPAQLETAVSQRIPTLSLSHANGILLAGMGGSGIAGQLAQDLLQEQLSIPLQTVSNYHLPKWVNNKSIVIVTSYSGTTEETIAIFHAAQRQNATIQAITSGGLLAQESPTAIRIPPGLQPRQALAHLLVPILLLLASEKKKEIVTTAQVLKQQQSRIQEQAQTLAQLFFTRRPLLYTTPRFQHTIYRWQTQFNENAKELCHSHIVPEMNHNEINCLSFSSNCAVMLLHEKTLSNAMQKRFDFLEKQLTLPHQRLAIPGNNALEEILYAVHLGDWTSYYLALLYQRNPSHIPLIQQLKKTLQSGKKA